MFRKKSFVILSFIAILILSGCGKKPETVRWMNDVPAALEAAKAQGKPVMIKFSATWCPSCKQLESETLTDSVVVRKLKQFIPVTIDVDKQSDVANAYNGNARKYGGVGIPNMLFLDPTGKEIKHVVGFRPPAQFVAVLDSVLAGDPKSESSG